MNAELPLFKNGELRKYIYHWPCHNPFKVLFEKVKSQRLDDEPNLLGWSELAPLQTYLSQITVQWAQQKCP